MGMQVDYMGDLAGAKKSKKSVTPKLDALKAARDKQLKALDAKLDKWDQSKTGAAPKKKKKKKKGGFFKKTFKAASKIGGAKALLKNPLVKNGLKFVPGGAAVSTAMDLAKSGNKKKAKEIIESPAYEQAEQQMEAKIIAMGAKYGVKGDLDAVLQGLAQAKQSGKLVKGSADDQLLTAYVAMQVNEEEVAPQSGGGGGALLAGGGIAALLLLL